MPFIVLDLQLAPAALGEAADVMVGLCFVPIFVLDLELAIYCDTSGYNIHTYNTENLGYD